jgi:monofunctional glycosyltransferase
MLFNFIVMKTLLHTIRKIIIRALIVFFVVTIGITIVYRFVPVPITPLMVQRYIEQDNAQLKKNWVPLTAMSPDMPLAVIASEDQLFMQHYGFDVKAIQKALDYNKKKNGKKIKGASTISQQTAKNVFLWQGRTWLRKGLEVYFTALIELLWSKDRIIEVYLNVIEMGRGVYGADAAAEYYFNKNAKQLNATECASIAAILPNPIKWSARKRTAYIDKRKNWTLKQMRYLREGITDQLFTEEEPEEEEPEAEIKTSKK